MKLVAASSDHHLNCDIELLYKSISGQNSTESQLQQQHRQRGSGEGRNSDIEQHHPRHPHHHRSHPLSKPPNRLYHHDSDNCFHLNLNFATNPAASSTVEASDTGVYTGSSTIAAVFGSRTDTSSSIGVTPASTNLHSSNRTVEDSTSLSSSLSTLSSPLSSSTSSIIITDYSTLAEPSTGASLDTTANISSQYRPIMTFEETVPSTEGSIMSDYLAFPNDDSLFVNGSDGGGKCCSHCHTFSNYDESFSGEEIRQKTTANLYSNDSHSSNEKYNDDANYDYVHDGHHHRHQQQQRAANSDNAADIHPSPLTMIMMMNQCPHNRTSPNTNAVMEQLQISNGNAHDTCDGPVPCSAKSAELGLFERQQRFDAYLSDLILKTYNHRRQPKLLLDYKCAFQEMITRCLALYWPEMKFKMYLIGSSLTNVGSSRSDIDLCMVIYDRKGRVDERYNNRLYAEITLEKISIILEKCGLAFDCKVIPANVPILKFYDQNQVEVNLNINKLVTVQNTMLLMHCCSLDARVAPFLFIVKLWAQKNGINCAYFKSLSSYSLSLMAIFFLQNVCQPPILPSFDKILESIRANSNLFHFSPSRNQSQLPANQMFCKHLHVTTSAPDHTSVNANYPPSNVTIPHPCLLSQYNPVCRDIPKNILKVSVIHSTSLSSSPTSTCSSSSDSSLSSETYSEVSSQLSPISSSSSTSSDSGQVSNGNLHFSPNASLAVTSADMSPNDAYHKCCGVGNPVAKWASSHQPHHHFYQRPNHYSPGNEASNKLISLNYFSYYYYFCQQQLQLYHLAQLSHNQHLPHQQPPDSSNGRACKPCLHRVSRPDHVAAPTSTCQSGTPCPNSKPPLGCCKPAQCCDMSSPSCPEAASKSDLYCDTYLCDKLCKVNAGSHSDQIPPAAAVSLYSSSSCLDMAKASKHHQHYPRLVPTSSVVAGAKSLNTQSLGSLFSSFIDFYSNMAVYESVISVRTGKLMKRTDPVFARSAHTSMDTFICVEEPFNHTNTSHSVHNDFMFNFIIKSFMWTRDSICKMKLTINDFV